MGEMTDQECRRYVRSRYAKYFSPRIRPVSVEYALGAPAISGMMFLPIYDDILSATADMKEIAEDMAE